MKISRSATIGGVLLSRGDHHTSSGGIVMTDIGGHKQADRVVEKSGYLTQRDLEAMAYNTMTRELGRMRTVMNWGGR